MNRSEMLIQTARLWLDPNQRDVAEIRLDDLLNPTAEDAIVDIWECPAWAGGGVRQHVGVKQESGTITRIEIDGPIRTIWG
jgi:hypothetical protein